MSRVLDTNYRELANICVRLGVDPTVEDGLDPRLADAICMTVKHAAPIAGYKLASKSIEVQDAIQFSHLDLYQYCILKGCVANLERLEQMAPSRTPGYEDLFIAVYRQDEPMLDYILSHPKLNLDDHRYWAIKTGAGRCHTIMEMLYRPEYRFALSRVIYRLRRIGAGETLASLLKDGGNGAIAHSGIMGSPLKALMFFPMERVQQESVTDMLEMLLERYSLFQPEACSSMFAQFFNELLCHVGDLGQAQVLDLFKTMVAMGFDLSKQPLAGKLLLRAYYYGGALFVDALSKIDPGIYDICVPAADPLAPLVLKRLLAKDASFAIGFVESFDKAALLHLTGSDKEAFCNAFYRRLRITIDLHVDVDNDVDASCVIKQFRNFMLGQRFKVFRPIRSVEIGRYMNKPGQSEYDEMLISVNRALGLRSNDREMMHDVEMGAIGEFISAPRCSPVTGLVRKLKAVRSPENTRVLPGVAGERQAKVAKGVALLAMGLNAQRRPAVVVDAEEVKASTPFACSTS